MSSTTFKYLRRQAVRLIQIAIYACVILLIPLLLGGFAYQMFFTGGRGLSEGYGYGNLWLEYSIHDRGVLEPKVDWLIATPVMPSKRAYTGTEDQWTFTFNNGNVYTFSADSRNLVWVDPDSGPQKISATLTENLIQRIDDTRKASSDKKFNSGEEFLSWVEESNAPQACSGLPATHPESKSGDGNKPQPEANASLYSYPEDKQPQITLKQAYEIAESLVVKLGYGQGFFSVSASVHGDEEQSGAGTWNLIFRNVKGDKIQFGIYFPQDRCFVAFIPKEGHYTEKEVTRDGKISKQWIEWQEKLRKDEKEAEKVFGSVTPLKKKEKETEP